MPVQEPKYGSSWNWARQLGPICPVSAVDKERTVSSAPGAKGRQSSSSTVRLQV